MRTRCRFVITCLGHPAPVVEAVHAYGGTVFCDVTSAAHARKSMQAGVDGLICVGAGAGGHASSQSGFSLAREIREFWAGCLVLGGAINDGYQIRAAEALGRGPGLHGYPLPRYAGIAGAGDYKQMVVDAGVADLVYTDRLSGVYANFLRASLERFGIDVATLPPKTPDMGSLVDAEARLWKDLWSAGQGVATIHDVPTVEDLVGASPPNTARACAIPPSGAVRGMHRMTGMASGAVIDFWFDFASPYGYFMSEKIESLATQHGRCVRWRPVLLFAVLRSLELPAPLGNVVKRDYMQLDFERSARFLEVPYRLPDGFPAATQHAARAFYLLDRDVPEAAVPFAHRAMRGYFRESAALGDPLQVARWVAEAAPEMGNAEAVARLIAGDAPKALLAAAVEEAVRARVFGSPSSSSTASPFSALIACRRSRRGWPVGLAPSSRLNISYYLGDLHVRHAAKSATPSLRTPRAPSVSFVFNRGESLNTLDLPMLLGDGAGTGPAGERP